MDLNYIPFSIDLSAEELKIDAEKRTIDLSITSETLVRRWWGNMVLGHNPGECRLQRIKTVGSFLFAHGRDPQQGVMPVGPILDAYLDEKNRKYRANLKFDTDERSELIWQKVQSGSLKGVSVGVQFYKFIKVEADEEERGFKGPVEIATDWEIVEISLEPTPAIPNVGVGLSLSEPDESLTEINKLEVNQMKFTVTRDGKEVQVEESALTSEERIKLGLDAPPPPPKKEELGTPAAPQGPSVEETLKKERERQRQIRAICLKAGIEGEDLNKYLDGEFTIEQIQGFALEKLSNERSPLSNVKGDFKDETDKFRAAAVDGLSQRIGVKIEKPAPGAGDFRHFSLSQLMQYCYQRKHGKAFWGSPEELFSMIATPGERQWFGLSERQSEQFSGPYGSSSDFPLILSNVANKSMLQAYQETPTTYQAWTAIGSLKDFKIATGVRMSEAEGLLPIGEHGEFIHAEMAETAVRRQLSTKGIGWSLTRKMIINDDLDAFSDMPAAYAQAARRTINLDVYWTLLSNPIMDEDSQPLYTVGAPHNNQAAPAGVAAVNVNSLADAYEAMMLQRNLQGLAIVGVEPRYILLPPSRQVTAVQFLTSTSDPAQVIPGIPNPYYNRLVPVVEPLLQVGIPARAGRQAVAGSQTAWRLVADARQVKTIQVDFLNGRDTPIMESQVSFTMLGIEYRMYHDWGVKAFDYRGTYLNTGQ